MGMSFNRVMLAGNLVKDPESREVVTKNGPTTVTEYTLAVNDGKGKGAKPNYIDCVCWGRTAEFAKKWLGKGRNVFVVGVWDADSYTNKDGKRVKSSKCKVNEHVFTGERMAMSEGDNEQTRDDDFFVKLAAQAEAEPTPENDDFIVIPDDAPDDGLPFA